MMPELKVCILRREDDGRLSSWVDLLGVYANCEVFEKNCDEAFVGESAVCTFSITPKDLEPDRHHLFFALVAAEKAMAGSGTPLEDHLPTHLLEEIIDKILQRVQPAIKQYPPISPGTVVRTKQPNTDKRGEWTDEGWAARKWGVKGKVRTHHDSHGLCYDVLHEDGTEGCYDPTELEVLATTE